MNEETIKGDDNIGLPPLKRIVIQFLRFIFSIVDLLLDTIKRCRLLLLLGVFAGLAAGFFYYASKRPYYEVSMIAESPNVHRNTLAAMIKSLNNLIISQSSDKLAGELGISGQNARQLSFVELTDLQHEPLEKDTASKFDLPFKIIARIAKPELTDTFQVALANYLNNKSQFKKTRDEQVKFYHEKLEFIEKELAKMDTLKTEYNHFFGSSKITTTYYSNSVDPSTIYKHANDLFNEKGSIMFWLASSSNTVKVLDEFKRPALPQTSSRFKSMVGGSLLGLGLCFLLGLFLNLHRKIKNYHEQI